MGKALKIQLVWVSIFGIWLALLSGVFSLRSPGILQAYRLQERLEDHEKKVSELEEEIARLEEESTRLEKSKWAQEREIRKVLGYTASDEIIFDFTSTSQASPVYR